MSIAAPMRSARFMMRSNQMVGTAGRNLSLETRPNGNPRIRTAVEMRCDSSASMAVWCAI
jgi:hypothetical protein